MLTRATVGFVRRLSADAAPNLGDNSGMPSAIGGPHRARIIALESVMLIRSGFTMDFGVAVVRDLGNVSPLHHLAFWH